MDHDFRAVTAPEFRSNPKLPKAVSKGALSAPVVLKTLNALHTGCDPVFYTVIAVELMWLNISPDNIFVYHIDACHPVAKLGDLGNSRCFFASTR